jgi:hypothetical protein
MVAYPWFFFAAIADPRHDRVYQPVSFATAYTRADALASDVAHSVVPPELT